jgi:hypothetical protein
MPEKCPKTPVLEKYDKNQNKTNINKLKGFD